MSHLARTASQIGTAIERARRARRLTQGQLGELVGLRQEAISKIESGNDSTRLSKILDILAALDLDLVIGTRSKRSADDLEGIF